MPVFDSCMGASILLHASVLKSPRQQVQLSQNLTAPTTGDDGSKNTTSLLCMPGHDSSGRDDADGVVTLLIQHRADMLLDHIPSSSQMAEGRRRTSAKIDANNVAHQAADRRAIVFVL